MPRKPTYAERLQHNEDTIVRLENDLRLSKDRERERTLACLAAQETLDLSLRERASYHAALAIHERYLELLERLVLNGR